MEWLAIFIWASITLLACYRFNIAVSIYLALKIGLIHSWVLIYLPGCPLITLDRGVFVALLGVFLYQNRKGNLLKRMGTIPLLKPWLFLLTFILCISLFNNQFWIETAKGLLTLFLEYFVFYMFIVLSFRNERELTRFFRYFGISLGLVLFYGLLNKLLGTNPFIAFFEKKAVAMGQSDLVQVYGVENNRFGIVGRVQSVIWHAVAYAGMLALYLPYVITATLKTNKTWIKFVLLAMAGVLVANLVLTNSRAGILTAMVSSIGSIFAFVYYWGSKLNRQIVVGTGFVVILVLLFNVGGVRTHLGSTVFFWEYQSVDQGSTLADREAKFDFVLNQLENHKWVGYGYGSLGKLMVDKPAEIGGAESYWIKVLYEQGILGAIVFAAFFIWLLVQSLGWAFQLSIPSKLLAIHLFFACLAYVLFVSLIGELNTFATFVMILGFSSVYLKIHKSNV